MEFSAAGRGDARRRNGRQVGPRRCPAPHLMQSAFRKLGPAAALTQEPPLRSHVPRPLVAGLLLGWRPTSASHREPQEESRSHRLQNKVPGCPNSDVETATERFVAAGGNSPNYVFPEKMGGGLWGSEAKALTFLCLLSSFLSLQIHISFLLY